jgi:16S rRNA (cytosine1402-N4)-methyltransferase
MLDGPLDMRMDNTQQLDAYTIVNNYSEAQLARVITQFGEDPKAHKIAHAIVSHRPVLTTKELATIVAHQWPGHHKVHPATRTFQALRIAVNNELELLTDSLPIWLDDLLAPGGRIGIISFHSLEDRLVKQAIAERAGNTYDAQLQLLTKHPIKGDANDIVFQPRARSAKLRAAAKIKT